MLRPARCEGAAASGQGLVGDADLMTDCGLEVSSLPELQSLIGKFKKWKRAPTIKKPTYLPKRLCIGYKPTVKVRVKKEKKKAVEIPISPMRIVKFTIAGKAVGYYSLGMKPNFDRMKKYHNYKKYVCDCARNVGIALPLIATKIAPIYIHTVAYFENGVHPDAENVRKGIVDSLFWSREHKGLGDKYCAGNFELPIYDKENPRIEIEIAAIVEKIEE